MNSYSEGKIAVIVPITALVLTGLYSIVFSVEINDTKKPENNQSVMQNPSSGQKTRVGNYVIVDLDTNILFLKNGTTTLKEFTLVSQGKPGSYYETIGGEYYSDYKVKTHFSSFGQVFMPFSIHLFGNYFIHGIPYHPDGTRVSSTYSGGCIRLRDDDAEYVYTFITKETPIIITREGDDAFMQTEVNGSLRSYPDMTRIMTAILSLEMFNQDDEIYTTTYGVVTRKDLLSHLLSKEEFPAERIYRDRTSRADFTRAMNVRAKTLGLTNTLFIDADTPVVTTEEDYLRFMNYVRVYKSFLLQY